MFEERSNHTLDKKGRLAIPARFREVMAQKGADCLVLTSFHDCLWAYTEDDWVELRDRASVIDEFDPDSITFLRGFVSGAARCPLKQNRITIPQNLREEAGLKKDVVLVGLLKKFEIWDKDRWEQEFQRTKSRLAEASRRVNIHSRGLGNAVPSPAGPGS